MVKTKIEIMEIDLGIDIEEEIEKASKNISSDTRKEIDNTIIELKEKKKIKDEKKQKKEDKQRALNDCIDILLKSSSDDPISSKELLETGESDKLSPLVLRIKNKLKKDGDGTIGKVKIDKDNYYYIIRE